MLIVLIAKKDSDSDSGFGLTILEYSRIVNYSELPIPNSRFTKQRSNINSNSSANEVKIFAFYFINSLTKYFNVDRKLFEILFVHSSFEKRHFNNHKV